MIIYNRKIKIRYKSSYKKNAIPYIDTLKEHKFGIGFEKNLKTLKDGFVNIYYITISLFRFRFIISIYKII